MFIVLWIACAVICACIAHYKNRSVGGWLLAGLLTGIGGVIVIACVPSVSMRSKDRVTPAVPLERPTVPSQPATQHPRFTARSYATALEQKAWREQGLKCLSIAAALFVLAGSAHAQAEPSLTCLLAAKRVVMLMAAQGTIDPTISDAALEEQLRATADDLQALNGCTPVLALSDQDLRELVISRLTAKSS